jgi:type IV fimbrial biogenesis protein FimT
MRQRGFSLIELMVAVTIMALLIVAAMPSLGTWLENTRIRNEGDSIINGLQTARAEAVRRNQNVSFWLVHLTDPATLDNACTVSTAGTDGSWVVSVANPAGHCADDPRSTTNNAAGVVVARAMGSDSTHVSVAAVRSGGVAAYSVTFNGFGRVAGSGSITEIDLDGTGGSTYRRLNVMVSTMGSVRMCDPLVTGTDPRKC